MSANVIESFRTAMIDSLGYAPETITPNVIQRFKDLKGKLSGWSILYIDGRAAGVFGCYKQGIKEKWKAAGHYPKLTDQQRLDFKVEQHRQQLIRNAELQARHNEAAQKSATIWSKSDQAINHDYLTKKRVKAHDLRIYNASLVIPIFNDGTLVSIQFIDPQGNKKFLTGGKLKGSYSQLGQFSPDKPVLICEGWATGASLHESTAYLVFVAFSAGNLKAVAQYVRSIYPTIQIIIMGDNDPSGVGQKAAIDAALSIGGKYLIPDTAGNDWNDEVVA